jgi:hypothetical protein
MPANLVVDQKCLLCFSIIAQKINNLGHFAATLRFNAAPVDLPFSSHNKKAYVDRWDLTDVSGVLGESGLLESSGFFGFLGVLGWLSGSFGAGAPPEPMSSWGYMVRPLLVQPPPNRLLEEMRKAVITTR